MIKKLIERLKSNQGPKSLKDLYAHYPDYRDLSPDDNDRFGEKFDSLLTELFIDYFKELEDKGIVTHTGTIIDATFVDAPRQRNTREENKTIKSGEVPEEWTENTPKAKHKLAQKDTDARWTNKNNETHYGYKNHAKVDADSKIITRKLQ